MKSKRFLLPLVVIFLFPPDGSAQRVFTVDATDVASLTEILRGWGNVTSDTDNSGDPLIRVRAQGHQFRVFFYGCNERSKLYVGPVHGGVSERGDYAHGHKQLEPEEAMGASVHER